MTARNGTAAVAQEPDGGVYDKSHRAVLLAAGEAGQERFRPGVVAARLGLSLAEGQRVTQELLQMGFLARETIRHVRPLGIVPLSGYPCEGPDENGNYYYVEHEDTPYCTLTADGSAEVQRLRKQVDGPVTLREYADEVNRLRAEVERLKEEARVLGVEDERLFAANQKLDAEVRRLRARLTSGDPVMCPRCSNRQQRLASFCPRCGTPLGHERPQMKRALTGR